MIFNDFRGNFIGKGTAPNTAANFLAHTIVYPDGQTQTIVDHININCGG